MFSTARCIGGADAIPCLHIVAIRPLRTDTEPQLLPFCLQNRIGCTQLEGAAVAGFRGLAIGRAQRVTAWRPFYKGAIYAVKVDIVQAAGAISIVSIPAQP